MELPTRYKDGSDEASDMEKAKRECTLPGGEGVIGRLRSGTMGGFVAIVLWSTTVALARSLSEQLGPLTAAATVYCVSGLIAAIRLLLARRSRQWIRELSIRSGSGHLPGVRALGHCDENG